MTTMAIARRVLVVTPGRPEPLTAIELVMGDVKGDDGTAPIVAAVTLEMP
jgi:hypothetical protein